MRIRRVVSVVVGVGLVVTGIGVAELNQQSAKAAQATSALAGFDSANIIDDAVMFNGSTMTAAQIQAFLDSKQPVCVPGATCLKSVTVDMPALAPNYMCGAVPGKGKASAAEVIAAVARACGVNPQVILVMLQKEQTLVTGRMPYYGESVSLIYRKATGLGCPDTAACDPNKYGLFNQLYGVAYWLVRYTTPPGTTGAGWTAYNWFPVGRPSGVLYNPNYTCGSKTLTIRNKATAALYYYTPYVPNTAALSAGWGGGDSCSAYGNRNFYLYFTTWFGSTHYIVTGAIRAYWTANTSTYGDPTGNAVNVSANGGGTIQRFAKGSIVTSPAGTFGVAGSVASKYAALGGPSGALGWPRKAASVRQGPNGGTVQAFTKGTVYASSAGTAAVLAPVYSKYGSTGYETGTLGWPSSDAVTSSTAGGATWQSFQGGRVVVAGSHSSVLSGAVLAMWGQRKAEKGSLGWPVADARTVAAQGSTGIVQAFQNGTAYVSAAGAAAVLTPVSEKYGSKGSELGTLGWPTSDAVTSSVAGGATWQSFQGGRVVVAGSDSSVLSGSVLAMWLQRKAETGALGWPVADAKTVSSHGRTGTVQTFQSGVITVQGAIRTVTGATGSNYVFHGGPTGTLGWPTGPSVHADANGGGWWQTFQGGDVFWNTQTGSHALYTGAVLKLFDARGGTSGSLGWLQISGHDGAGIGGAFAVFQNGRIYSSRAGTDAVLGDILALYLSKGGTSSVLGWPTSNAHSQRGVTVQTFQHGRITWTKSGGAKASRS